MSTVFFVNLRILNIRKALEHHSRNLFLYANVLQTGETPSDTCLFSLWWNSFSFTKGEKTETSKFKCYVLYSQDDKGKETICHAIFALGFVRWFIWKKQEGWRCDFFGIVVGFMEDKYSIFPSMSFQTWIWPECSRTWQAIWITKSFWVNCISYIKKRPADLSIVKRLGGFLFYKDR